MANKKIAEAFRRARAQIRSGRQEFICNALYVSKAPGREAAQRVVMRRIKAGGLCWGSTLDTWVRVYVGVEPTLEQMRAYRLRWLDALIEEFEG